MHNLTLKEILNKIKTGEMDVEDAEKAIQKDNFVELGYAKLDSNRSLRSGFPEVVFCSGKSDDHLLSIYKNLYELEGRVLGTRATEDQYQLVKSHIPEVTYDPLSRILKIETNNGIQKEGYVVVCSAGTADISVAEEAAQTVEYFGGYVERIYDVGVSGIHRLFAKLETIKKANCIITVAGMEGALASVIGGLVSRPVIAVPTSVGYGANLGGISALLTMINSCANGISVVNIDNGYGAGYNASLINRLATRGEKLNSNQKEISV